MGSEFVVEQTNVDSVSAACANQLGVSCKPSSVGAPKNEPRNESAVGLPRARAPHSHRSLGKGGTTLFSAQQGTLCANKLPAKLLLTLMLRAEFGTRMEQLSLDLKL